VAVGGGKDTGTCHQYEPMSISAVIVGVIHLFIYHLMAHQTPSGFIKSMMKATACGMIIYKLGS